MRTDPLADAVVDAFDELGAKCGFSQIEEALSVGIGHMKDAHPAIVALFREVERLPAWVDFGVLDRAGELLLRSGAFGGLILGCSRFRMDTLRRAGTSRSRSRGGSRSKRRDGSRRRRASFTRCVCPAECDVAPKASRFA